MQTRNGNVNLKWETTTQTNVGVDLGFLNGDLNLTLDYFNKDTKDLLWRRALPLSLIHISLNNKISDFIPELKESNKKDLSIKELLYHQSGVTPTINFYLDAIDKDSYCLLYTSFVNRDAFDKRRFDRENSLYTYVLRHLTNCETFFVAVTGDTDNNTAILLDTLFVTL